VFRSLVEKILGPLGYTVVNTRKFYARDGLFTAHRNRFEDDSAFRLAYERGIKAGHGVDPGFEWRVHVALWAARTALRVPGDFVECGVNAGLMSSAIMQSLNWRQVHRKFYLIDTFAGPVFSQYSEAEAAANRLRIAREALDAGAYVTDMNRVLANYSEWPNAVVVPGSVPEILPDLEIDRVAFLHLDMDCAYPETSALEFFWDRLVPGAVVLLDDYTYRGYEVQGQAMDGILKRLNAHILSVPTGQGLIIR
jgi:hypothetical protein